MTLDFRQRLLATTLLVSASLIATPAFAQDVPPPEPADPAQPVVDAPATPAEEDEGEIVVTGTRIPQPNLVSSSPVTVLSSQDIKLQGTSRTEDLINSLPQSFGAQGSNISNGSTGTATVNLRGLGTQRTLVLVNGRRLQPGDPRQPVSDINFIPSSIVKRVDVLTGGASSVYGADAVAGVVNFIMDTGFTGLRIDGQASVFQHNNDTSSDILAANAARGFDPPSGNSVNGGAQDISVAFGTNFADSRGHIMAYATYRNQEEVLQGSRDYSFCSLQSLSEANIALLGREFNCGGSATSNFTSVFANIGGTFPAFHVEGNQLLPGTIPFNFGPYNFYQRPQERYTFGAFAEYEISSGFQPYVEAMFMHDVSNSQIAPSGNFFNTTTINCDNPLLSTQQFNTLCVPSNTFVDSSGVTRAFAYVGRRNVEGGGRQDHLEHTAYRVVAGMKGDILDGVSYDSYYQFGSSRVSQVYLNDFSVSRLLMAMDVVANPAIGGTLDPVGTPVCRIRLTDPTNIVGAQCVPYNVWQEGGVTQEALNFLQIPLVLQGHVNETVANLNFTIDGSEYGMKLPWADQGIGLNVGFEYRKEALETTPDSSFQSGDGAGQGSPTLPVEGEFDVRELFAEVQIPIVKDSFIDEFTITAGYRYSDYEVDNDHFNTDTYKIEGRLAPIKDVLLRGSYNRAVRAPNVVELFSPVFVGLGGTVDPCAGLLSDADPDNDPTATAAQCANTGVTAAQYGNILENPANQYNAQFGGNLDLEPEKADSYTLGVLLQPRFVPGLSLSIDWFNIKVENLISTLGFQTIMNQCLASGDPFFCGFINRNPSNGRLWGGPTSFISTTNVNIGGLSTKGFDLNGNYTHQFGGLGTANFNYVGTILRKLEIDTGVAPVDPLDDSHDGKFDCAGLYGNTCGSFLSGAPNPKYRHKFRAGFTFPNGIGISGQWRYFSSVKNDGLEGDCDIVANATCTGTVNPANREIKSQSYFDLAATARFANRYSLRLGVNNIFDKEPPIVGSEVSNAPFGNGNTFPQVYDALGRYFFAGFTVDF